MNIQRRFEIRRLWLLLTLLLLPPGVAQGKHHSHHQSVCSAPHPESLCNQGNTCGSASTPCMVDVKRTSDSASAIAGIANPKANTPFCVKAGTKVTWQSLSKDTGFVIDFGATSPFDPPAAAIGGSDRFGHGRSEKARMF